jgi:hypothetical protein
MRAFFNPWPVGPGCPGQPGGFIITAEHDDPEAHTPERAPISDHDP